MEMVVTLALILTFSPGEKEQRVHASGFEVLVARADQKRQMNAARQSRNRNGARTVPVRSSPLPPVGRPDLPKANLKPRAATGDRSRSKNLPSPRTFFAIVMRMWKGKVPLATFICVAMTAWAEFEP